MIATQQATLTPPVSADDYAQGPATALVTLVEYGDFECPFCGQAYPIVKAIQDRFGDQLRFVWRNFPLAQAHPHAQGAAEAAEAAGAQGAFWGMHDLLFAHQDALGGALLHPVRDGARARCRSVQTGSDRPRLCQPRP